LLHIAVGAVQSLWTTLVRGSVEHRGDQEDFDVTEPVGSPDVVDHLERHQIRERHVDHCRRGFAGIEDPHRVPAVLDPDRRVASVD